MLSITGIDPEAFDLAIVIWEYYALGVTIFLSIQTETILLSTDLFSIFCRRIFRHQTAFPKIFTFNTNAPSYTSTTTATKVIHISCKVDRNRNTTHLRRGDCEVRHHDLVRSKDLSHNCLRIASKRWRGEWDHGAHPLRPPKLESYSTVCSHFIEIYFASC